MIYTSSGVLLLDLYIFHVKVRILYDPDVLPEPALKRFYHVAFRGGYIISYFGMHGSEDIPGFGLY